MRHRRNLSLRRGAGAGKGACRRMGKRRRGKEPGERPGLLGKMFLASEVPTGLWGSQALIEINGNRRITVEGYRGILEYEPDHIKLNLGKLGLRILGSGLEILLMQEETIVIQGMIVGVEYSQITSR